jgi:hypothetical protein
MTAERSSNRLYLYVPPEDEAEVEALGALKDSQSACWYIGSGEDRARFSKWLAGSDGDAEDEEFSITSDEACVASATVSCWRCQARIEVICIYCESGTASGEPLARFTVSHISAMDGALVRQLEPWRTFRESYSEGSQDSYFANHCPHCGAVQEDLYLHSEPDQPFFSIPHAEPGAIKLTPLPGRVRLSGDESFEI